MPRKKKIDGYTIENECGRGAFGTVYVVHGYAGRHLALKQISLTGTLGQRELEALKRYQEVSKGTDLLQIHHISGDESNFYYTMDLADNINSDSKVYVPYTLSELLNRKKQLTVLETLAVIRPILDQLAILHSNKLVHRDIKPANIFWVNKHVKLGDMGLLANENSMTCNAGSRGYMPPENSGIEVNSSGVDLYAVTRLIYACLTGKHPDEKLDIKLTDDLKDNGCALIQLMMLENDEIASMTIADFQKILAPETIESGMNEKEANKKAIKAAVVSAGVTAVATTGTTIAITTATAATAATATTATTAATAALTGLTVAGTTAGTIAAAPIAIGVAIVGAVGFGTWAVAKKIFSKKADQKAGQDEKEKPS